MEGGAVAARGTAVAGTGVADGTAVATGVAVGTGVACGCGGGDLGGLGTGRNHEERH